MVSFVFADMTKFVSHVMLAIFRLQTNEVLFHKIEIVT